MKFKYFNNPTTLEELKAQYKKLAFQYHPDVGGDNESMKAVNAEYDELFSVLKNVHRNAKGEMYTHAPKEDEQPEAPEEFRDLISKLVRLAGVTVELCGSWLWVSGDTRAVKDDLKAMGFRFSANKAAWYYHRDPYRKHGKKTKTLDEIRRMYDSYRFTAREDGENPENRREYESMTAAKLPA